MSFLSTIISPTPISLSAQERSQVTYFWDRFRGGFQGLIETCWQVFALLIAIRYFEADTNFKQYITVGTGLGSMVAPFTLSLASRSSLKISTILAGLWLGVALSFFLMTFASNILIFIIAICLAQFFATQGIPLITHVYNKNYHPKERGSKLSTSFIASSVTGVVFGYFGGILLDSKIENYVFLLGIGMFASVCLAVTLFKIPSEEAVSLKAKRFISNLSVAWTDKIFFLILSAWMFMGIGNLMLIPIRVEYLANPIYGINASNANISLILVSVVLISRLISTKIWGLVFDKFNVITVRIMINMTFVISIFCFFTFKNLIMASLGASFLGIAFGGGGIMWSLYVTKVAPSDKVTSYMSVHVFLTGLRMAVSPILGYTLLTKYHPTTIAWFACLLIALSTFLFIPLRKFFDEKKSIVSD